MGEVPLPQIAQPQPNLKLSVREAADRLEPRRPSGVMHGPWIGTEDEVQVVMPYPDLHSMDNLVGSVIHRYGRDIPQMPKPREKHLRRFGYHFVRTHFPKLDASAQPDLDGWLNNPKYRLKQRLKFLKLLREKPLVTNRDLKNGSFLKFEPYKSFKWPRSINAYNDFMKAVCGPYQRVIDLLLFHETPWGVKHRSVAERPQILRESFGNRPVDGTDFTAAEVHHLKAPYNDIRVFWKQHIAQASAAFKDYLKIVRSKSLDRATTDYANRLVAELDAVLLSGDCSTSSDN